MILIDHLLLFLFFTTFEKNNNVSWQEREDQA